MGVFRSPSPPARIKPIDPAAAAAGPGVVAVYTASDFKSVLHGYLPVLPTLVPEKRSVPDQFALAEREVVYQGEPVAGGCAGRRHQPARRAAPGDGQDAPLHGRVRRGRGP